MGDGKLAMVVAMVVAIDSGLDLRACYIGKPYIRNHHPHVSAPHHITSRPHT